MDFQNFPPLNPKQFKIPPELKVTYNRLKRGRGRNRKQKISKRASKSHYLEDFVEDKDFLKWYRNNLPLTQKILNAKYVEKQNYERELSTPISSQKFKSNSLLFTFQEKFASEVLNSLEYSNVFDGFKPHDWYDKDPLKIVPSSF